MSYGPKILSGNISKRTQEHFEIYIVETKGMYTL